MYIYETMNTKTGEVHLHDFYSHDVSPYVRDDNVDLLRQDIERYILGCDDVLLNIYECRAVKNTFNFKF